ncbi:GTPase Era [bacterium]|nr:GTPase Era [bacterium]
MSKAGYIAIVGKPNVGKSTLLNSILDETVSITSPKEQTTRDKILAVHTTNNSQFIFLDSPGIHLSTKEINRFMLSEALSAIKEADLVLFLTEYSKDKRFDAIETQIIEYLEKKNKKTVLIVTKTDKANSFNDLKTVVSDFQNIKSFSQVIPISSTIGFNKTLFYKELEKYLPEHPFYFPEDFLTDKNDRFMVKEVIREQIFLLTHHEIPHESGVIVEKFTTIKEKLFINAIIVVAKESQKGILIGKAGQTLKKIGTQARLKLESIFGKKVQLETIIRVEQNWNKSADKMKQIGYNQGDIELLDDFLK